jgi:hypothetical protein
LASYELLLAVSATGFAVRPPLDPKRTAVGELQAPVGGACGEVR